MAIFNRLFSVNWFRTGAILYYTVKTSNNVVKISRRIGFTENPIGSGSYNTVLSLDNTWDRILKITVDDGIVFHEQEIQILEYSESPNIGTLPISPHSLLGLPHYVMLRQSSGDTDDGAGGIVKSGLTTLITNFNCRISTFTGDNDKVPAGFDGQNQFYVVGQYSLLVSKGKYITVSPGTTASIVAPIGDYLILWYKHQIDETGKPHHTSFIMEKE